MKQNNEVKMVPRSSTQVFRQRTLESISTGFYFAAAVAWMDVVRAVLSKTVKVKNNSQTFFALTAIFTTLISVVVSMMINRIDSSVRAARPMFAVM